MVTLLITLIRYLLASIRIGAKVASSGVGNIIVFVGLSTACVLSMWDSVAYLFDLVYDWLSDFSTSSGAVTSKMDSNGSEISANYISVIGYALSLDYLLDKAVDLLFAYFTIHFAVIIGMVYRTIMYYAGILTLILEEKIAKMAAESIDAIKAVQ